MFDIRITRRTSAAPEAVLGTLLEPAAERRNRFWANVKPRYFELHHSEPDMVEVTEATFVVGRFWERSRYERTAPQTVTGTVLASNVFRPGSTWQVTALPREDGGSEIVLGVRRRFRRGPKGRIAASANHLGGRRLFGWYLGTVLKAVEEAEQESSTSR